MNPFGIGSDDFGVNLYLAAKTDLPTTRETVLHFFEAVQKQYPTMTEFEKREGPEYALEEDRDAGSYRWLTLDSRRVCSGFLNPPDVADADQQNERVLEMAPYHLGLGGIDCDLMDVLYYFDFAYAGNHDEVVAEALAAGGAFEPLVKLPAGRVLHFQPTMTLGLDEGLQLQARLSVETRTTAYQVRAGNYSDAPISVYFTVRQFWGKQTFKTFGDSYRNQRRLLDELVSDLVVPNVLQPLAKAIGAKQ